MPHLGLPPKLRLAPLWPALAATLLAAALLWALLPAVFQRGASVQLTDMLQILDPLVRQRLAAPGDPRLWIPQLAAESGLRITLIAGDGTVLGDSTVPAEAVGAMENHRHRPEVIAALARGEGMAVRKSATTGHRYVYVARAISGPGGRVVVLRLAEPLEELEVLQGRLLAVMAAALGAALVVILVISLWLDRRLFRPLSGLIDGAADLASGRASRVEVPDERELAALAHALNRLAATAEEQFRAMRGQRDSLHEILSTMTEGVLVVDGQGRAVMANPAFCALVDYAGDPAGHPVLEIVRHPGFAEVIELTLRRRERQARQIELQSPERRTVLLETAPMIGGVGGEGGAVLVASDTTELTRVGDMRRDFVANVSHELRTPLAAIRGYAETLRDGALDEAATARRFTERILLQSQRLQALLEDLLTLSRLEGVATPSERSRVDLRATARHAADLVASAARERAVEVEVEEGGEVAVLGDPEALERLLVNLLENGIKYNRPEGRVDVGLERQGNEAVLAVADTGIGIPAESIGRIFERFYRVDKGRARDEGGTGLGLAIVKHIAQAHGGQVEVDSRLGKGSTFRVRLPLAG